MFELIRGRHQAQPVAGRPEAALQAQIATLESELAACRALADDRAHSIRALKLGIVGLIVALGLEVGINLAPVAQLVARLARSVSVERTIHEDAYAAYQRGDYETAIRRLLPMAELGDARAQSVLGLMYYYGRGVPQHDGEALRWFGHAADQGDAAAQFNLGNMYAEGRGVARNDAEAARRYRLAADRGYARAQYNLGLAYTKGEGVAQDYVSAHMWFNIAAAHFSPMQARQHEQAIRSRNMVAGKMTRDEIAAAQRRAQEWSAR
jgi:TPR repeat protein